MENKIQETKREIIEYSKLCPHCKTKIISMYPNQLSFNFGVHVATCNENPVIKQRNDELKRGKN